MKNRRDVIDEEAKTVFDSMRLRDRSSSEAEKTIPYRGRKVGIVEEATGFVSGRKRFWVRALDPVAGYEKGGDRGDRQNVPHAVVGGCGQVAG